MSIIITTAKGYVYRHTAWRFVCYAGILLALLLFWLYGEKGEIAFVYNAF